MTDTTSTTGKEETGGTPPVGALFSGGARSGRGRGADDSGFTPAEIIIGVILLAILATSVVAQALELRQQAQDAAAQTTLRSAVSAARGAYSLTLPGGLNNYVAQTNLKANTTSLMMSNKAVETLSTQEPNINFITYESVETVGTNGKVQSMTPAGTTVWVHMPRGDTNLKATSDLNISPNPNALSVGLLRQVKNGTQIRAGDLIRLGIVAASGSSFCAVLVADSSNGSVSGIGFQSVDEASTLAGYGADCGAAKNIAGVTGAEVQKIFKEMPGTTGTDPSLSRPLTVDATGSNAYGAGADAQGKA